MRVRINLGIQLVIALLLILGGRAGAAVPSMATVTPPTGYTAIATPISVTGANLGHLTTLAYRSGGPFELLHIPLPEPASQIMLFESTAYLAAGSYGLGVVDLSLPTPVYLRTMSTLGQAHRLVIAAGYAYLASGEAGLAVLSLAQAQNPQVIGRLPTAAPLVDLVARAQYLYLAAGTAGVLAVSLADPTLPVITGGYRPEDAAACAIFASGTQLFALTSSPELLVCSIADPARPSLQASLPLPAIPSALVGTESLIVVGFPTGELLFFEVSAAGVVTAGAKLMTPGPVLELRIAGAQLFVSGGAQGITTVDLVVASAPKLSGFFRSEQLPTNSLAIRDEVAYLAGGAGESGHLTLLSGILAPQTALSSSYNQGAGPVLGAASGASVYLIDKGGQLTELSTEAVSPQYVGSLELGQAITAFRSLGGQAFATSMGGQLIMLDLLPQPAVASRTSPTPSPYALAATATELYIADYYLGLCITDLSGQVVGRLNPNTPGSYSTAIAIDHPYAYLACGSAGVATILVTNPATPALLDQTAVAAQKIALSPGYLWALAPGALHIFDLADPAAPQHIKQFELRGGEPIDILATGDRLFVLTEPDRLWAFDITDPPKPYLLQTQHLPGAPSALFVSADRLGVVTGAAGLLQFDLASIGRALEFSTPDEQALLATIPANLAVGSYDLCLDSTCSPNIYRTEGLAAPTVYLQANQLTGDWPLQIDFTASASDPDGSITSYQWDLDGDGTFEIAAGTDQGSYTYTVSGVYLAQIRVIDNHGLTATATCRINITGNIMPQVELTADISAGRAPLAVAFTAVASDPDGTISQYEWDLDGDGIFELAGGDQAQYSYTTYGPQAVSVRVWDNQGGATTASLIIEVSNLPTVTLTATPESGKLPLSVLFTASAFTPDGQPLAFWWDPGGDGEFELGSGNIASSEYTYLEPGVVMAAVRVQNSLGAVDTATVRIEVTENKPPQVELMATPTTGRAPVTVALAATASDADGSIAKYEWDPGGNGTFELDTELSAATHWNYLVGGVFTVQVRVQDNDGATAVATAQVIITENLPPSLLLFADSTSGKAPHTVQFITAAADQDGRVERYEWDFNGDGVTDLFDTSGTAVYTYTAVGSFEASVQACDNEAAVATAAVMINVREQNAPPTVTLLADSNFGVPPLVVKFTAPAQDQDGQIVLYQWDLDGDGVAESSSLAASAGYTYTEPGRYKAQVTVTDDSGSMALATTVIDIPVNQLPEVALSADFATGKKPLDVSFVATATDPDGYIVAYRWDFDGNGSIDYQSDSSNLASYTYDQIGVYQATLYVDDNRSGSSSVRMAINVLPGNSPPSARLESDPLSGPVPFVATVTAVATSAEGAIVDYAWDLDNDGTIDRSGPGLFQLELKFEVAGSYLISVRVTDNQGLIATAAITINVQQNRAPMVIVTADQASGLVPLSTEFTAIASDEDGHIAKYEWDLDGDGVYELDTRQISHTSYTYQVAADYLVRVRVTDGQGATSEAQVLIVATTNNGPVADLDVDQRSGKPPVTVKFQVNVSDIDGWVKRCAWDFDGDLIYDYIINATSPAAGGELISFTASHTYREVGVYTATAQLTDNLNQVTLVTTVIYLSVNQPPVVSVRASLTRTTAPAEISLVAEAHDPDGRVVLYEWDLNGDGVFEQQRAGHNGISFVYTDPGTYHPKVRITDNAGASASASVTIEVLAGISQPPAWNDDKGCFIARSGSLPRRNRFPVSYLTWADWLSW